MCTCAIFEKKNFGVGGDCVYNGFAVSRLDLSTVSVDFET